MASQFWCVTRLLTLPQSFTFRIMQNAGITGVPHYRKVLNFPGRADSLSLQRTLEVQ
jgi:hypothetical protein